jgi:glycerophosphoryl diester phosphodiesterase
MRPVRTHRHAVEAAEERIAGGLPVRVGPVVIVTARFIQAAHRARLPVHVWTINDQTTMHQVLELGLDGVMTDQLALMRDVMTARGLALAGP